MYWLEISVTTDGEGAEAVSEMLRPYAYADSVVIEQLGDEESSLPDALDPAVTVKIFVPQEEDIPTFRRKIEEVLYHMNRLYPIPEPKFTKLHEEDWANVWRKKFKPFRVGQRIRIQPSWLEAKDVNHEDILIVIDPGMAFGTGLHPSTQMCLKVLENRLQPNDSVLDVGTGSGILAIAAAKLGASHVLGLDTDRPAVMAARDNAIQNQVEEKMELYQGVLSAIRPRPWDFVVVNILAPVIISLLTLNGLLDYVARDGRVVLSGIVQEQIEQVQKAVMDSGGAVIEQLTDNDWVCLVVNRKTP